MPNNYKQGTKLRSANLRFALLTLPQIGSAPFGPCCRRYVSNKMEVDKKVKVISFNNELLAPENCDPSENYWLLIGKTGKIVRPINKNSRVLVQFEQSIKELGLHCHNEIPNSLLILTSDLKPCD